MLGLQYIYTCVIAYTFCWIIYLFLSLANKALFLLCCKAWISHCTTHSCLCFGYMFMCQCDYHYDCLSIIIISFCYTPSRLYSMICITLSRVCDFCSTIAGLSAHMVMHMCAPSKDTNAYFFKSSRGHIWHNDFSLRLVLLSAVHDLQSCSVIINLANTITNHPPTFSSAQLMIMNIRHDILSVRSIATHQKKFKDTEQWVMSNKITHTIKLCPNILL